MKILVIPDVHCRIDQAQALIDKHGPRVDSIIMLGDYFDAFKDTPEKAADVAYWLKNEIFSNPKIVPLCGNHDLHYYHPTERAFRGTGYSHDKLWEINKILTKDDWRNLKAYMLSLANNGQAVLFSHAGLDERMTSYSLYDAQHSLHAGTPHPLLLVGESRGGDQPVGGILWEDIRFLNPAEGYFQYVGHTPTAVHHKEISMFEDETTHVWCLDTRGDMCYAIVNMEDGRPLEIG